MKKEMDWGRGALWMAFLILVGGLAVYVMAKINHRTPVCEAQNGVLSFSASQLEEGPFMLVGEWERFEGLYTPQQLEAQPSSGYQDIRLPEMLSGATYRMTLYSDCMDEIYFIPSRPDLRVWLNGKSVVSSAGTQNLKTSDLYRIADYAEGSEVEVVFQAGVGEEVGAYALMIAGGYNPVSALRNLRLTLDSMRIGLYVTLLACCLTLFWGKRSERYLLFLAGILLQQLFSWRSIFGYVMSDTAAARLDYLVGFVHLLVNVFPYLIYRQMDSFGIPKWCDRIALGAVILSETVYLIFRVSYYSIGNVISFVYYALAFYLIGRAVLRRVKQSAAVPAQDIAIGDMTLSVEQHAILKEGKSVNLSPIEYDILRYFVENPNRALRYEEIYRNVWKQESLGDIRTVFTHVRNLRKKIEDDPSNPKHILTVARDGYLFQL